MEPGLEKRIKRQVIGKPHRFVAIAPLGFENTLASELEYLGVASGENTAPHVVADGKVEFTARITEAWKAVAYSRIANRILMEIGNFKAENFGQLEKKAAEIPWELYLPASHTEQNANPAFLDIHVTCKHSRLYHSDAVKERIINVILKADKCQAAGVRCHPEQSEAESRDLAKQHLYVTLIDDRCTIWQDLAGEELYKRGHDRFVAEAPLKETIAAAMIFEASRIQNSKFEPTEHQSNRKITIIDPMAGSGTFSLEAAYIANGLIPGKCRDFALKHQPAFKEATWNFITGENRVAKDDISIITSDISERAVEIIRHNAESSPLPAGTISPKCCDFFSYSANDIPENAIILLNPPYGKRLDCNAPALFTKIGEKLAKLASEAQKTGKKFTVAIMAPKDDTRNGAKYTCSANLLRECPWLSPFCNEKSGIQNSKASVFETSHGGFSLNVFIASSI